MSVIAWLVMICTGIFFFLSSFVYYINFYVERLGVFWGWIIGGIFSEALFPVHFIIVGVTGGDIFEALFMTYGILLIAGAIIWICSLFLS